VMSFDEDVFGYVSRKTQRLSYRHSGLVDPFGRVVAPEYYNLTMRG
jgi:hypothetical protein